MRTSHAWWMSWLAGWFVVFCAGCTQNGDPKPVESSKPSAQPADGGSTKPKVSKPEPPPPLTVPEVHLLDSQRSACLVYIDDPMPDGELVDFEGNSQRLSELWGEKLTVLLFWSRGESTRSQMAATVVLEDLGLDVAEPYLEKGVAVIAVNVNDSADTAKSHVDESEVAFPNLSDPQGTFFARVATEGLPRVYLLDAQGKILWLDPEFSYTTRRNLLQGIQVELGET